MNPLQAETTILARLREQITDVDIASVASLSGQIDLTARLPLLILQPGDSAPKDTAGSGRASLELQLWEVYLAAAAVPDKRFLDANLQDAGAILGRVYEALVGWTAFTGYTPLEYHARPKPRLMPGWAELPIVFRCNALLRTG